MKSVATVLICLVALGMSIWTVSAITPITLDVNLQEDGANIDTSKLVTINYNTEDAATPPNPLPVSINTVDDLDPDEGPIYAWGLYDSNNNPCTGGPDCKSKLYAGIGIYSAGTDIVVQVEGYEDYTFPSVMSNVGPVDVDLTPSGDELSVTVLYPNGGESIPLGTQVPVSAHATDDNAVTSVTFYYSNNSGSNWNQIGAGTRVSGTAKDGTWNKTWNTNSLSAGTNYLIKAVASDGTSTDEDQSNSAFSLTTCTPPLSPTLNDPGTTDTDGNYTVIWSSVSGATSYTLEEDTSSSFSSPAVYSEAGTSKQITGKSNGTYYYRVKACNAGGCCSGWSNVEDIVVSISHEVVGWEKTFGGPENDAAYSVQKTSDGGYILTGYTDSYGAGDSDFWLLKTDSGGNEQWNETFGGADHDIARSVQETTDGGFILAGCTESYGAGSYDAWVLRIDSNRDILWHMTLGGTGWDGAYSVQETTDGGFILAGYTEPSGAGFSDFLLVKIDSNGFIQWEKTLGGTGWDKAKSVRETTDGGFIIAGFTGPNGADLADVLLVKTDSNGNKQWEKTFGGDSWDTAESVRETTDGGFILAGYTLSNSAGSADFWLLKTYSNGNKQWEKTFGGPDDDYAYSVQETTDGGFILAGCTAPQSGPILAGGSDAWLVKTYSNGSKQWDKSFGGADKDFASAVLQISGGGYILAGYTKSRGAGGSDFWLLKVNGEGTNSIFDTSVSANPYPSLSGTHTGTITLSQDIPVQKVYTYPCAGTGGHTESVRIYGNEIDKSAAWNGYVEEWSTLTFNSSFTLEAGKTYYYVIKTGSYPQIHHTSSLLTENGWLNCTKFVDANGKEYDDWVPAIRLWS